MERIGSYLNSFGSVLFEHLFVFTDLFLLFEILLMEFGLVFLVLIQVVDDFNLIFLNFDQLCGSLSNFGLPPIDFVLNVVELQQALLYIILVNLFCEIIEFLCLLCLLFELFLFCCNTYQMMSCLNFITSPLLILKHGTLSCCLLFLF